MVSDSGAESGLRETVKAISRLSGELSQSAQDVHFYLAAHKSKQEDGHQQAVEM